MALPPVSNLGLSAIGLTNRSRLDFFIISESVLSKTTNCSVPHSLTSTVFDHKPVYLSTKRKKIIHKQIINDLILDDPDLDSYVMVAVYETYLQHAQINDTLSEVQRNAILNSIGQISVLQHRIRSASSTNAMGEGNELGEMEIEGLRAEVRESFEDLPQLAFFENLELTCDKATFLRSCLSLSKM